MHGQTEQLNHAHNRSTRDGRRLRFTILGMVCVAFGLLIWSRLLLVTSYPKTAIAEPAAQSPAQHERGREPAPQRAATDEPERN